MRAVLVAAPVALAGCSLAFDPEGIDGIVRCTSDDDCPEPPDNRYAQKCMLSEDVDVDGHDVESVCVAVFNPLSCYPGHYPNSQFELLHRSARMEDGARYKSTCGVYPGAQGCPARDDGSCDEGLAVDSSTGLCDDDDPRTPPAWDPTDESSTIAYIAGQDVLDQFCRSYFCDMDFVCDRSGETSVCVPCSGLLYGSGGCGDLYFEGRPSPIYQTAEELEKDCRAPDSSTDHVLFGSLYRPPEIED